MTSPEECSIILEFMTELFLGAGVVILSSGDANIPSPIKSLHHTVEILRPTLVMTSAWEQTHKLRQRGRAICRNPRLIEGAVVDQSP